MRKLPLSILFLSMGMVACTNNTRDNGTIEADTEDSLTMFADSDEATVEEGLEVENKEEENQQIETIKQFLADIYKHCSANMKQILRDEYDYDGEGWGSWLIGGWGAGEEILTTMTGITYDGQYYYATLRPEETDYEIQGERVIRFEVSMVDGIPVINSCKWTRDFSYGD